jgi:hypothetical protein
MMTPSVPDAIGAREQVAIERPDRVEAPALMQPVGSVAKEDRSATIAPGCPPGVQLHQIAHGTIADVELGDVATVLETRRTVLADRLANDWAPMAATSRRLTSEALAAPE